VWKILYEAALIEDRAGFHTEARQLLLRSLANCPDNLKWKVWIAAARLELHQRRIEAARDLLRMADSWTPRKTRSMVLLEQSRLEECVGNADAARAILRVARAESSADWKVFLESISLEVRAHNVDTALELARESVQLHPGTGRLWALLIQLCATDAEKVGVFREALQVVPKSGELWCEGARMLLNPTSALFNLERAEKFLQFAIDLTPQYG
jgi:tetratricopeptide (TPR) repeat protein